MIKPNHFFHTQMSDEFGKQKKEKQITFKVGMLGDSQVGKTSMMVKYVDGSFDEDYIVTLGMQIITSSHILVIYEFIKV